MNEDTIFGLAGMGFALLIIAFVVVIIVSLMKVWRTKIQTAKEEVYQKLAADAIQAQEESAEQQKFLATEMADVKERLASIEKILKEVE